jgi:hypothetical protein
MRELQQQGVTEAHNRAYDRTKFTNILYLWHKQQPHCKDLQAEVPRLLISQRMLVVEQHCKKGLLKRCCT